MLRAALLCLALVAVAAQAQDAGALRARHAALQKQLADNPFGRALHVESTAAGGRHKGEINAVIDQPYRAVAATLSRSAHWCDVLVLQVNVKRCSSTDDALTALISRKPRQRAEDAYRVDFRYRLAANRADYLHVALNAAEGPMGTRDYEIRLEAAPLDAKRTFLRMSYTYTLGTMARLAMDAYLAGPGRDKRGFTVEGGERGVIERGAMRYYLAVEAYLESKDLETRLRHWYSAVTRYPQLREPVTLDEYVEMKRREAPQLIAR